MTTTTMIATIGALSAVMLVAATAEAQVYGGYLPPPAYAEANTDYTGGGEACGGFTLAGARAGVTVLGVDIDAGAGLRIGTSVGCGRHERRYERPAPYYAPPPSYAQPPSYAPPPGYAPPPAYAPMAASPDYDSAYGQPPPAYGYGEPCGCSSAPIYSRQPSRYGW